MTPATATKRRGRTKPAAATPTAGDQLEIAIPVQAYALTTQYVPHESVHPDPEQPRTEADAELRASIAQQGILQPITVRPHPDLGGAFLIIDGERRWQGSRGVQADIPVIVRYDHENALHRLITQLVANTGKPLSPVEEARAYARILELGEMSQADLARQLGIPRTTLGDRLRLLELGPWIAFIEQGLLPISVATKILVPYRGLPATSHETALVAFLDGRTPAEAFDEDEGDDPERQIEEVYRDLLHPLTATSATWKPQPEFPTKDHDTACGCGGIKHDERLHCGNPLYWKPRLEAARAAAKKRERAERAKADAGKPSTPTGPRLELPSGTPSRTVSYYEFPKELHKLTTPDGRWHMGASVARADWFDPTVIEFDPDTLVRVKVKSSMPGDLDLVATSDREAITHARALWAARWAVRRTTLESALGEELQHAPLRHTLTADEGVLRALLSAFDETACPNLVEVAIAIRLPVPTALAEAVVGFAHQYVTPTREWLQSLDAPTLVTLLLAYAEFVAGEHVNPLGIIAQEQKSAIEAVSRQTVPWVVTPPEKEAAAPAKKRAARQPAPVVSAWDDDDDHDRRLTAADNALHAHEAGDDDDLPAAPDDDEDDDGASLWDEGSTDDEGEDLDA